MIPLERLPVTLEEKDGDYNGPLSTFKEWHSATLGLGLGLALALSLALVGEAAGATVAAVVIRTVLYAHTGKEVEIAGKAVELPAKYLRQIRAEPHYLDGGIALGFVLVRLLV